MNKPTMPPSLTVEGATHEDWVNHYFRMADYWLALEKWHEARIAALEADIANWKRLYDRRGLALARPCIACGHVPAAIKPMSQSETSVQPNTIPHTDKPGGTLPWKCPVCGRLSSSWQTFCAGCTYDYAPKTEVAK